MAAVAGILTTELIGAGGNWWSPDASAHVANGAPTARVFAEAAVMAVAESFRLKAFDANGPGSKAFDPAGMKSDETLLKEIKNGRLAMVAFLGFTSQAAVRGMGPIACLKAHLADPGCVRCGVDFFRRLPALTLAISLLHLLFSRHVNIFTSVRALVFAPHHFSTCADS